MISVVMSVYNGALYLRQSLDSILAQTYKDFEFIVVDDGSFDNTWEILQDYASKDDRFILVRNGCNMGLSSSLNKGVLLAQGNYIARQDDDDVSLPNRFEKQVRYLDAHSDVAMISCNIYRIDATGRLLRKMRTYCQIELIPWYLLFSNHIRGHSQVMFRRKTFMKTGGYSEVFKYSQDYDLWVRLLKHGKIDILPDFLQQYRWHDNRISHKASEKQIKYAINVSAVYLNELIGEKIDFIDAYRLWSFWTIEPTQSLYFQQPNNIKTIHNQLKKISRKFIDKHLMHHPQKRKLSREMSDSIGERYLKWILLQIYMRSHPKAVIYTLAYSCCWLKYRLFTAFLKVLLSLWENKYLRSSRFRK